MDSFYLVQITGFIVSKSVDKIIDTMNDISSEIRIDLRNLYRFNIESFLKFQGCGQAVFRAAFSSFNPFFLAGNPLPKIAVG